MTRFHDLPPHLARLGDQLVAAADQINATDRRAPRARWQNSTRRLSAVAAAVAVVAIPGVAFAATQLLTNQQVATGLADGNTALVGTAPTCTAIQLNVEYHCSLAKAPSNDVQFSSSSQSGGVQITVTEAQDTTSLTRESASAPEYAHVPGQSPIAVSKLDPSAPSTTSPGTSSNTADADWTGVIEPTIDPAKDVNGACRAQNSSGTQWDCYIGQAAVTHDLIAQSLLGQSSPAPAVG